MSRLSKTLRDARSGVAAMPRLMGMICGGAMLSTPILLIAVCLPVVTFKVDGQDVVFADMWKSGLGETLAVSLLLSGLASWGLAFRRPGARWLAVAAPIAPVVVAALLPRSAILSAYQQTSTVLLSLPYAIGIYLCLFHLRSVRRYLFETAGATTPNISLERTREG
jgi:hypothetical protein